MTELSKLLRSPIFWFASVFIAFLMSLAAAFVKDWISDIAAKMIKSYGNARMAKLEEENHHLQILINQLKGDPLKLVMYRLDSLHLKVRELLYLIVAFVSALFAPFAAASGFICIANIYIIIAFLTIWVENPISRKYRKSLFVINKILNTEPVEAIRYSNPLFPEKATKTTPNKANSADAKKPRG